MSPPPRPSRLLLRLAGRVFREERDREAFVEALMRPPDPAAAVVWSDSGDTDLLPRATDGLTPAWMPAWVTRLVPGTEAGKRPEHDSGRYYCLDFGSVLAASPLLDLSLAAPRVLDLCAAPGGKSLFALRALKPGFLLANEVSPKRLRILRHNLARCRAARTYTQRFEPARLRENCAELFDVVLVDAPCSGQSLLLKGVANPGCFHPTVIRGNARRQRSILASAAAMVKAGGFLLYTSCTFSREENESNIAWFLRRFEHFAAREVPRLAADRSALLEEPCYRWHPQEAARSGAGGFACLLQKGSRSEESDEPETSIPPSLLDYPVGWKQEVPVPSPSPG